MSLILDALNKADQERRKHDDPPGLDSHHDGGSQPHAKRPTVLVVIVAVVLLVLVVIAALYFFSSPQNTPPVSEPATATPVPAAVETEKPETTLNAVTTPADNTLAEAEPTQPAIADNTGIKSTEEDVAALYQQPTGVDVAPAALPTLANATPTESTRVEPTAVPSPVATPIATTIATPVATPEPEIRHPRLADFSTIGGIRNLAWTEQEQIPSLNYSEHHYAPNEQGHVVINGKKIKKGGKIDKNLVLESVLQDGVLLRYKRSVFTLPALNSWVNM